MHVLPLGPANEEHCLQIHKRAWKSLFERLSFRGDDRASISFLLFLLILWQQAIRKQVIFKERLQPFLMKCISDYVKYINALVPLLFKEQLHCALI
jgi:hypothetical protein